MIYDINGNSIVVSDLSGKQSTLSHFNFSAYTTAIEKNASVTPSCEFKSDDVFGDKMYCGGICANNKIYFCPNTASNIMVYDTVNDYIYFIGNDLGDFAFKYTGMVAYKGYLYCIPRGVNNILKINPVTDEVFVIELDTNYPIQPYNDYRDSHHYNGVISDEGWLYSPPAYSSDKLLKINMETFEHEELDFTCSHSTTWTGCCNIPDNKIVFFGNKGFRVWDCSNDSIVKDINAGTTLGIYDMVFDPRDKYLYGYGNNKFARLSTSNYSYDNLGYVNYLNTAYGTVLGIDGLFYTITGNGTIYAMNKNEFNAMGTKTIVTCKTDGMTVCSAGMVLATDGSIYSVPGNGRLIKVSFSDVIGRLPDYIVTGRYYGKY